MRKTKALWLMMMGLALFSNACAVKIYDFTACGLIPGNQGAECDGFLTSNPQSLTEDQWVALQSQWNAAGSAVECVQSASLAQLKGELEKACSAGRCTYETAQAIQSFFLKVGKDERRVRELNERD